MVYYLYAKFESKISITALNAGMCFSLLNSLEHAQETRLIATGKRIIIVKKNIIRLINN